MRQPAHGLLLDEPSLGQDSGHKTILMRMLRALADACQLVIMTTHDLTLASQAGRLILLGSGGEIVANGGTDAVLRDLAVWQKSRIVSSSSCSNVITRSWWSGTPTGLKMAGSACPLPSLDNSR